MAKKKLPNSGDAAPKRPIPEALRAHAFQPGQSGNPEGARKHNPIRRALKNLTVESYRKVIEAVCTGNVDNLREMIADPKTSALQVGVATAFVKALQAGDYVTIERIAERIVGKIPDELKVTSANVNANLTAKIDLTKMKAALAKLQKDV